MKYILDIVEVKTNGSEVLLLRKDSKGHVSAKNSRKISVHKPEDAEELMKKLMSSQLGLRTLIKAQRAAHQQPERASEVSSSSSDVVVNIPQPSTHESYRHSGVYESEDEISGRQEDDPLLAQRERSKNKRMAKTSNKKKKTSEKSPLLRKDGDGDEAEDEEGGCCSCCCVC